eukprot:5430833-Alexandrium_andersonii.AAC.1
MAHKGRLRQRWPRAGPPVCGEPPATKSPRGQAPGPSQEECRAVRGHQWPLPAPASGAACPPERGAAPQAPRRALHGPRGAPARTRRSRRCPR